MQEVTVTIMPTHRIVIATDWSSKLNEFGSVAEGLEDIKQCIAIILCTLKGSVPHRLDFGTEIYKYVDLPPQIAIPYMSYEVTSAIEKWEPRAVVDDVDIQPIQSHHYCIKITWHPADSDLELTSQIVQEVNL